MRDKEILRKWLMALGYQGDGEAPELTDDVRVELSLAYTDLCSRLLDEAPPLNIGSVDQRIRTNLQDALQT